MEEKKYIDRLYQEKFKDFEAAPRKDLWKGIAVQLHEEKRRKRLVPVFWTRLAGVAAVLTLILLLGDWLTQPVPNSVVTTEEEVFNTPPPEEKALAVSTEEVEDEGRQDFSASQKRSQKKTSRLSNIIEEISSITASGIKSNSFESKDVKEPMKAKDPEQAPIQRKEKSLSEVVLENELEEASSLSSTSDSRIEISTHAAPIYFGNLKSGNFIDSRFDNNNSEGEVTFSYGINISYELSEKLKIRSGINKVSMSHNTNDIAFHAVVNPRSLESIDYRDDLGVRVIDGSVTWKGSPEPIASAIRSNINNITEGLLKQRIGFIEVPLEVEYALITNRFSVNLIGGASTLFLDENSVSISSGEIATQLGQANNLNDVSFSTNLGVGLDYQVSEKFQLNMEPMFKYQINTYDVKTGTYQPYYIGIYTGFSYKF